MSAFLSPEEMHQLTGYKKPSLQIRELRKRGLPHIVNRFGRAVVSRDVLSFRPVPRPQLGAVK